MIRHPPSLPAITVLLSCYNGARWLDLALESVLRQSFSDFEFIVVNDGSTDDSSVIIESFAQRDKRIVIVTKPNTGLADSLNIGIQRAQGKWIARLDADDICEPTRLERQHSKIISDSNLVFVGAGFRLIDELGGLAKTTYRYSDSNDVLLRSLCAAGRFPPHSSAFYSAQAVRNLGGYRSRVRRAEDWDLWLRLSTVGKLGVIDEPMVRIRKHADQISHDGAGRSQIVDSRVAIVSYWLCRHGHPDPVDAENEVFTSFRTWVEKRLQEERLFEWNEYISRLRGELAASERGPVSMLGLGGRALAEPGFLVRYLRMRTLGESISKRLALQWIEQTKRHEPA